MYNVQCTPYTTFSAGWVQHCQWRSKSVCRPGRTLNLPFPPLQKNFTNKTDYYSAKTANDVNMPNYRPYSFAKQVMMVVTCNSIIHGHTCNLTLFTPDLLPTPTH